MKSLIKDCFSLSLIIICILGSAIKSSAQVPEQHEVDSLKSVLRQYQLADSLRREAAIHKVRPELLTPDTYQQEKRATGGRLALGITMTGIGAAMLIGSQYEFNSDHFLSGFTGYFFLINGLGMAIPGVILTIHNGIKLGNLKAEQQGQISVGVTSNGGGFRLIF